MNSTSEHSPNHLQHERSPYLQQHAFNPVDWYPWGEQAFTKARNEAKPIFLSIGYSTCHWCHVMERESFEDVETARYLNEHFVSIKVDREELPDVDHLYMSAVQAISGSGGWPLTVFLTPELKPFFGGTYFPPQAAYGRPSFRQLLSRIVELWRTDRDKLVDSSEKLLEAVSHSSEVPSAGGLEAWQEIAARTYESFEHAFDSEEGGFGTAPKFPRPVQFEFLFRYAHRNNASHASEMALFSLRKMALGGINDQLGGGFHRYSVDRFWRVSHFEKMLYDQAQLVEAYLDAFQISKDPFFAETARSICDYVLRDMRHPMGGFYSAEDADSEGVEGTFYVWTRSELDDVLGVEDAAFAATLWGVTDAGNFEHRKNVLYSTSEHRDEPRIDAIRQQLLQHRARRVRPHLDDKILASWNGLMIGALARAGALLQEDRYIGAAHDAAQFVWDHLRTDAGQLLHRWRDGEARFDAYLDTYAFLIKGYLGLYQATSDTRWLSRGLALQHEQQVRLLDQNSGGYFLSAQRADMVARQKPDYDGAEPNGNSVSIDNLRILGSITGREEFVDLAKRTADAFQRRAMEYPSAMPLAVAAAMTLYEPAKQLIFSGSSGEIKPFVEARMREYQPELVTFYAQDMEPLDPFYRWIAADDATHSRRARAYFCSNFVCELPIEDPLTLGGRLKK